MAVAGKHALTCAVFYIHVLHKTTDIDVKLIIFYVDEVSNIFYHTVYMWGRLPRALNKHEKSCP
jgi:hypothetical protein